MRVEEKLSAEDREKLERLDRWGSGLYEMDFFSECSLHATRLALGIALARCLYGASLPLMNKLVIGAVAFCQPWMLWAVRFMEIGVDFRFGNDLLFFSGVHIGCYVIKCVIDKLLDKAYSDVKSLLSKYRDDD